MATPTTTPEQDALLAAIVAQPDEDTPRLVYADWLEEHGAPEQAKFIRESIAFAKSTEDSEEMIALAERLRETEKECWKGWLEELGVGMAGQAEFDRGMPDRVGYWNIADFLDESASLFARLPIRDLSLVCDSGPDWDEETLAKVAAIPELARLHVLRMSTCYGLKISVEGWRKLIGSPHLRGLQSLSVTDAELTDDHAIALAESVTLAGLVNLDLSGNQITVTGALALMRSSHLKTLTRFSVAEGSIPTDEDEPGPYRDLVRLVRARFGNDKPLQDRLFL
jgi:uncharacterized protein (TIGR02996 family)